jgi:hypothetical protein
MGGQFWEPVDNYESVHSLVHYLPSPLRNSAMGDFEPFGRSNEFSNSADMGDS